MPERFQKICRESGCTVRTNSRSGYCPAHEKDNARARQRAEYDAERHKGPFKNLYTRVAWARLKSMLRNRGNVICQRIVDGKQCTHYVEIFHHVISPEEDVSKMYDWHNIRGVCRQHHPNTPGEPKQNLFRLDEIYAPTIWSDTIVGE